MHAIRTLQFAWFLKSVCLCLFILGLFILAESQVFAEDKRPNIVFFVVDDLGYGELGCQGNSQIPTPNIDSIANGGIRCTQGYVTASYCSQSRAGFITGRHQVRFGYLSNPIGAQNDEPDVGLPLTERTMGHYFREGGYVTGLVGKWHLGASSKYLPLRRGFDEFFGFLHEGHYYGPQPYPGLVSWLRRREIPAARTAESNREGRSIYFSKQRQTFFSNRMGNNEPIYDANNPIYRNGQPHYEKEYLTDAITRESMAFIRMNKEHPFFLMVSYNAVHSPMQGKQEYFEKFKEIQDPHRRVFAAMLASLDASVGKILKSLKEHTDLENTLIVLISDNGGPTRELTSSNGPLRGGKGNLYEGGIRVPFLIQWKKELPSGQVFERPISSLDLLATYSEVAGLKTKNKQPQDGVNLIPYLKGKSERRPHKTLYWQSKNQEVIRSLDMKLVRNRRLNQYELFDLNTDVGEKNDLGESRPDELREMKKMLESERERIENDRE